MGLFGNQSSQGSPPVDSVRQLRSQSKSDHEIIDSLSKQGYSSIDIYNALNEADRSETQGSNAQQPSQSPQPPSQYQQYPQSEPPAQTSSQSPGQASSNPSGAPPTWDAPNPSSQNTYPNAAQSQQPDASWNAPNEQPSSQPPSEQASDPWSRPQASAPENSSDPWEPRVVESSPSGASPSGQAPTGPSSDAYTPPRSSQSSQPPSQYQQYPQSEPSPRPSSQAPPQPLFREHKGQSSGSPRDAQIDQIDRVAEAIIDEKWKEIKKYLEKIVEWKGKVETRIIAIEQNQKQLGEQIIGLQKSLVDKVQTYDRHITDVGTEIKAMEKVFQKIIPSLTENVNELSNVVHRMKDER